MRISLSLSLDGGADRTAASRSLLGHGNAARQEQPAAARFRRGRVASKRHRPPRAQRGALFVGGWAPRPAPAPPRGKPLPLSFWRVLPPPLAPGPKKRGGGAAPAASHGPRVNKPTPSASPPA